MDAHEAALLVWQLGAKVAMPMHHVLWEKSATVNPDETLDPKVFESTYRKLGGTGDIRLLEVGEGTSFVASQLVGGRL